MRNGICECCVDLDFVVYVDINGWDQLVERTMKLSNSSIFHVGESGTS